MDLLPVDPIRPAPETLARAAERLRRGELVAFPTETVYGLGADATSDEAVARIYAAKGRPSTNPLIVHVPTPGSARDLVAAWPGAAEALAKRFWPGPLTLVLPRRAPLASAVTAGLDTVGVRIPSHPVAQAFLAACGTPVAAPSANPSTRLSPTTAAHVAEGLVEVRGTVLDGGPTPVGIESTVVSLAGAPTLLRPGAISAAEIEEVIGPLARPGGAGAMASDEAHSLPSPGMLDRHYAPRAVLRLVGSDDRDRVVAEISEAAASGRVTGALLLTPLDAPIDHVTPMPDRPEEYARLLYASLHALDRAGAEEVWVEAVPEDPAWEAVRDRLRRAATR